jgi:alpha-ribazole phosphatase/probable phosphoglycerate mutase
MSRNTSKPSTTLVLVRHAHTDVAGTFCGTSDPPLSAEGLRQLAALNERLKPYNITHKFSSDLQRARQTAESIAQSCRLQVHCLESLHELAFGSWEGLDWDQIMARDSAYAQRWLDHYPSVPAPGGEDFSSFLARIQQAMNSIVEQAAGGCAVVVTHGGVIRTFMQSLVLQHGAPFDLTTCDYVSCWEISREAGRWHLPGLASANAGPCAQAGRESEKAS